MSDILTGAELAAIAARWDGTLTFEEYDRCPCRYGVDVAIAGKDMRAVLASHAALEAEQAALVERVAVVGKRYRWHYKASPCKNVWLDATAWAAWEGRVLAEVQFSSSRQYIWVSPDDLEPTT